MRTIDDYFNNILKLNMRTVLLLLSLLCLSAAFNLVQNAPAAIPWPFTVCGEGKWTIESLTLGAQPTKNSNNNIDIVPIFPLSQALLKMTSPPLLPTSL